VAATGHPDYQLAQGPNYQTAFTNTKGNNSVTTLITSGLVYRVWLVWLSAQYTAASTYAGGGTGANVTVVSDFLGQLAAINLPVTQANDHSQGQLVVPLYGVQAGDGQALHAVTLNVPLPVANTFADASAGLIYSVP
jgi:hypothetical protein